MIGLANIHSITPHLSRMLRKMLDLMGRQRLPGLAELFGSFKLCRVWQTREPEGIQLTWDREGCTMWCKWLNQIHFLQSALASICESCAEIVTGFLNQMEAVIELASSPHSLLVAIKYEILVVPIGILCTLLLLGRQRSFCIRVIRSNGCGELTRGLNSICV